jgi:hypothetical protein
VIGECGFGVVAGLRSVLRSSGDASYASEMKLSVNIFRLGLVSDPCVAVNCRSLPPVEPDLGLFYQNRISWDREAIGGWWMMDVFCAICEWRKGRHCREVSEKGLLT